MACIERESNLLILRLSTWRCDRFSDLLASGIQFQFPTAAGSIHQPAMAPERR
jgi:hypothetical protein